MKKDSPNESSLKQRHQEATRAAILEAAEAQLTEHGLHGTRMEDIAARAGVAVGTIYNHLGDRHTLLSALVAARRQELIARVDAQLDGSQALGFEPQLVAFVRAVFDHFQSHRPLFRILVEEEAQGHDAAKRPVLAALVGRAEQLIRAGIEAGALPTRDVQIDAALLVGMMRGILVHAIANDLHVPSVAERVVAFFLAGVRGT